jgi:predicted nucleotidyltransferase component of viral defense system
MIQWLSLSDEERRNTIAVVAEAKGLPENAIEKDWWVTLVLRAVFSTPLRRSLLFKGGTSLSKGWDLIERFSEDIDLALNREAIGAQFAGEISNRAIGRLREDSHRFVREEFWEILLASFAAMNLPEEKFSITQDEAENADPHLLINYQSLYEPFPYLSPRVKIEINTRSLMEPWTERPIRSFIGKHFSDQNFADSLFEVPMVEPRRTFLEKAFLLHEEFLRERDQIRVRRMSRHLYDLEKLMDTEHGMQALTDTALYEEIVTHRSRFYKRNHVNYETLSRSTINFMPPAEVLDACRNDYTEMSETMFYGEVLTFDELMGRLQDLIQRFRFQ